jgi:hypothetical protein
MEGGRGNVRRDMRDGWKVKEDRRERGEKTRYGVD